MKKIALHFLLTLIAAAVFVVAPVTQVAYAEDLSEAPVMVLSTSTNGKEVTVEAVLKKNTGILGMTLELDYDSSVMALTNVEKGKALSDLDPIWSNGYDVKPFTINWLDTKNRVNDTSTGTVLRMRFQIKETAPDGVYTIRLKGSDNQSVTYLDNNTIKSKNILIGSAKIKVQGEVAEAIDPETEEEQEEKTPNIALIVSLSVIGSILVATGVVFVVIELKKKGKIRKKGKDSWKKVE